MRNYFRELDSNLSNVLSPVVKWIIYLCVGMYVIFLLATPFSINAAVAYYRWFGASVSDTILKGRLWQLFTYAFVHAGFGHLFFNLLALYFFAQRLEYRWGSPQFLKFCLIVGAGAVLTHLSVVGLLHAITGSPMNQVIVGISGIVYGVMLACALYYPDDIVYFQFLIPIKLKYLVGIMAVLTFISSAASQGNIAHLTHLGGLIFAFLYVKVPRLFDWIPAPRYPLKRKPHYVDPRERWRNFR